MGKKYFVISDVHSFYEEMRDALMLAGFRKKNKDHVLIVVGDLFDRGPDAIKTYNYIHSIPKYRRIMIKGNHEDLYLELLGKSFPEKHDRQNMTLDTFCQLSGMEAWEIHYGHWPNIKNKVYDHPITKWLKSNEWKDYYELGPFIFTHSFIPTNIKPEFEKYLMFYDPSSLKASCFEYDPNWRNHGFYYARWGCPFTQYKEGLFKPEEDKGKILVCGHWHTGDFFKYLDNNYMYEDNCSPIYYSKHFIGLDGGVIKYGGNWVHPQNVLVIDEDWNCYDKYGDLLKEGKYIPIRETVSISDIPEEERRKLEAEIKKLEEE